MNRKIWGEFNENISYYKKEIENSINTRLSELYLRWRANDRL